jgi:transcriptional regulator with XRE-family HTH domain
MIRRKPKSKKTKTPKKRGPNGSLNKKQTLLIETYLALPPGNQSKWEAYNKAGYQGNKKACLKLFDTPKIKKHLQQNESNKLRITPKSKRKNKQGNQNGLHNVKLNESLLLRMEKHFHKGLSQAQVASLVGIRKSTISEWKRKGREALKKGDYQNPYAVCTQRIEAAKVQGESFLLDIIRQAAIGGETLNKNTVSEKRKNLVVNGEALAGAEEVEKKEQKIVTKLKSDWRAADRLLQMTRPEKYGHPSLFGRHIEDDDDPRTQAEDAAKLLRGMLKTVPKPDDHDEEEEYENE